VHTQIDNLREFRQAWREWLEIERDREQWCYEETMEWNPETSRPGPMESEISE
jgi:hypothetical protein